MQIEFDLNLLSKQLGRERGEIKGIIRKIIGAFAIRHDINEAKKALDIFWTWHEQRVVPSREELGDVGEEGLIGRAIFVLAAMRLNRALDMGADGRARIDLTPAIRKSGLEQALVDVKALRNEELAHYGGFATGTEPFSDDRALLIVDNDNGTYIAPAYLRWSSSRTLALKMASLIFCSITFIDEYLFKNRQRLLDVISNDEKLRSEILSSIPKNLFFSESFFGPGIKTNCPQEGPTIKIDW